MADTEQLERPRGAYGSPHTWEPYLYVGDGYKASGFRRSDGAGYVLPIFDEREWKMRDQWWVTWAHPMMCGRPGWHHHALGAYPSADAGALAFDTVYALERYAGNIDRMTREDCAKKATTTTANPPSASE